MNIFVLDQSPSVAASYHCDKHVVKMPLEAAQMLCSIFPENEAPYKRTHYNHPCSIWARESYQNYLWLCCYGISLSEEYTRRYEKVHKSSEVIRWCLDNVDMNMFDADGLTPFAQCMPDEYKCDDACEAYRAYYIGEKADIATWKTEIPDWWWGTSPSLY